ncbi:MAG: M81 family metallopeptidase [Pseudomonadota bacterium]
MKLPLKAIAIAALLSIAGCALTESLSLGSPEPSEEAPIRIGVIYFNHEATTFSPDKADLGGFSPASLDGDALLRASEDILGLQDFAKLHGDIELVPIESFGDVIGGSSVGALTAAAWDHYTSLIVADIEASGPLDAIFLSLHGCAAVDGVPRPEAELARIVREVVGPEVPIAGTFDPHGNEDDHFLKHADFSFSMKYFPHYDGRLQGERAAKLLTQTLNGDYDVTSATRRPGIITPTVLQWTGADPWASIVQRALTWEAREKDVYVNVFTGFPWNDSVDAGATIQVMTNNDQELADKIAQDMSDYMWRRRFEMFSLEIVPPGDAVTRAIVATESGDAPVVLADYSDRGGDATHILREIVEQDLGGVIYATLRDENVINKLKAEGAEAGDAFDELVGGFVIEGASGEPQRIQGQLVGLETVVVSEETGYSIDIAAVAFGRGNLLLITSELVQVMYPETVEMFGGLDIDAFTTWVVKSRAHFRRGFDVTGFAKTIMIVDAIGPSLGTVHLDALEFENVDLDSLFPFSEGGVAAAARGYSADE